MEIDKKYESELLADIYTLKSWARDVFKYTAETFKLKPSEPHPSLLNKEIEYTDELGYKRKAKFFDKEGRLVYPDLRKYRKKMFINQSREQFRKYNKTRLTWQQTVILTAYNRALQTFGMDSYVEVERWISTLSGHGIGKTACQNIIAHHFLTCFPGCQIGVTANTEQQIKDIFLKEFYVWNKRLPKAMQDSFKQTDDHIRIEDEKDWFLRAQVARQEKPEALAGLHGEYILILVEEASGVHSKVFEVMKGALTGDNYIVMYFSNGTRAEGEFYDSHKAGAPFTSLQFDSRDSPIIKPGYAEMIASQYGEDSIEFGIRVAGRFPDATEMDDKGWMPLFANVQVHYQKPGLQMLYNPIMGVDPAGKGSNHAVAGVRDEIYLKEVLNEQFSTPKQLAGRILTIADAYNIRPEDIGIDSFGIGAKVIANLHVPTGSTVNALLLDKPREETKDLYASEKAELAWMLRTWIANGGVILTNNPRAWKKELECIRYKRDLRGRITLMPKAQFKKEFGFSPDLFDMAIYTFHKESATKPISRNKNDLEREEAEEFMRKAGAMGGKKSGDYSVM